MQDCRRALWLLITLLPWGAASAQEPGETYTTIWYDQWRIANGRADEHWDISSLTPAP